MVGILASNPEHTADAVRRAGAERVFDDAQRLIESPDIDVVHICTPNHLHRPLTEAALAAGKHVVCEKPLAVDLPQAAGLRRAADAAGVVATVPFVYRFYPMVREARARLAGSTPVLLVHGGYLQDWLSTDQDDNWRVDAAQGGASRAFADIGSHWCDLVEFVTGDRIASLCAELVTAVPQRVAADEHPHAFEQRASHDGTKRPVSTEDIALVMFRTARGVNGSLVVSQVSAGHKNQLRFEVVGAESTLAFDQEHPDTLWVGRRGPSQIVSQDPAQLHPSAAAYVTVPAGHPQGYQDCFDAFVADTYRAIGAGSADAIDGLPSFADGARAAEITDAVVRSSAQHGWVDVGRDELAHEREERVS